MTAAEQISLRVERFRLGEASPSPRQTFMLSEGVFAEDARHMVMALESLECDSPIAPQPVEATTADRIVAESDRLVELSSLISARRGRYPETWVSTHKHQPVAPDRFIPISEDQALLFGKPLGAGLFTSHAGDKDDGMWRVYLEANESIGLHPRPWESWHLVTSPDARVITIDTATQWAELISRYPRPSSRGLVLDWYSVAKEVDGVEITLRAVYATEGVPLLHRERVIAPVSWTVETTVWLRWVFSAVQRRER